jgi:hypothetical protein
MPTSPRATTAEEKPLTRLQFTALLRTLRADFKHTWPAPDCQLPKRPLTAEEWEMLVSALHESYSDFFAYDPPRATDTEPGSLAKLAVLRQRCRARVALFSPLDAQLTHAVAGANRALAKLADHLRAERHAEASARASAVVARKQAAIQTAPALLNGRPAGE